MNNELVKKAEDFVKHALGQDSSGHDWYHIDRVRKNALYIVEKEQKGDHFVVEMAALLHDIPDDKLNESEAEGYKKLNSFFDGVTINEEVKLHILEIISTISFKGGRMIDLPSIEAKIVQDADRLDAIGAIGVARAFAYGGKKGTPLYDPSMEVRAEMTLNEYRNGRSSTVHHFYEKLLLLKDRLHTNTAKNIAEKRHQFMENFLHQFYNEWNGQA
ncbi:HD domain-containing protein [Bacillus sp. T3]|uniref:HD domain-containing protein n=1 Tax=Bacillus sp. T3 TaxID=467262 RepID=UPI0029825CAB|nr:HD domain-containing protein [Bacillus sp. T3]